MSNTDAHFNEEDNPTMNSNDEDDQPPPLIPREQVYFPSLNDPESHAHYYYHPDSADSDEEDGDVGLPPDSDEDPDDNEDDFDDDLEDATEGDEEAFEHTPTFLALLYYTSSSVHLMSALAFGNVECFW
jgi:hypothetical protein